MIKFIKKIKKNSAYLNEMLIFLQMCVRRVKRFSECVKFVFLFVSKAFKIDRLTCAFEKKNSPGTYKLYNDHVDHSWHERAAGYDVPTGYNDNHNINVMVIFDKI